MSERVTTGRLEIEYTASDSGHEVVFDGQIDERSKLVDFVEQLSAGQVAINLEKVSFINSVGVREWIRMLRKLDDKQHAVRLRRCSEAMIHQVNMIVEAKGNAEVDSFYAPYQCDECGFESSMCIDVGSHEAMLRRMEAPQLACPECKAAMEFNEIPERYFLFLE